MENTVTFPSGDSRLWGVLHRPDSGGPRIPAALVMLHGWSGCRLGPHRMFVKTARRLALRGIPVLRFDFRGRGDSEGDARTTTVRTMTTDALAAIDFLREEHNIARVVLLGICSGAKVAVSAAVDCPAVERLVLWSAEPMGSMRRGTRRARKRWNAARDYLRKLAHRETWRKILSGNVRSSLVAKALRQTEMAGGDERREEDRTLERFRSFAGRLLFLYGANDPETPLAAPAYKAFCARTGIPAEFHEIPAANHSFYSLESESRVMDLTEAWLIR